MNFYAWVLPVLFLSGCVGTQSRQAFTPRSASPEPPACGPNQSAARDQALKNCIDSNIHAYEVLDEPVRMQGE